MMEWVLQDHPNADAYIDDIIIGSTGKTLEEAMRNNYRDTREVLQTLKKQNMACKPKSDFFAREVTFCGHILREGRRSPAPGKLLPIQFWELPKTVTDLRGFLGLTNYFSEYVPHYATFAAPLSAKLKLNRQDGKKGSKLRLKWEPTEIEAFHALKRALTDQLELWQVNLDKPFRLRCDASDFAIGAELCQQFGERWLPVALFSRKLAKAQLNWVPREKETYAIVAALRKWGGLIGFQPVVVTTDHKALENWVTEHVDTPSGPRGRRARWHETLSQFDITVVYVPGPDNVVADAMSRWAYPASSARHDVSFHGSAEASEEVKKMVEEELAIAKTMAVMSRKRRQPPACPALPPPEVVGAGPASPAFAQRGKSGLRRRLRQGPGTPGDAATTSTTASNAAGQPQKGTVCPPAAVAPVGGEPTSESGGTPLRGLHLPLANPGDNP
jgi:hypothetical protein